MGAEFSNIALRTLHFTDNEVSKLTVEQKDYILTRPQRFKTRLAVERYLQAPKSLHYSKGRDEIRTTE